MPTYYGFLMKAVASGELAVGADGSDDALGVPDVPADTGASWGLAEASPCLGMWGAET